MGPFAAGASLLGAGASAAPAAGGAGLLAGLGPWGLASAGLQAGASIFGATQARAGARDAINAAEEAKARDWGFNMFMMDRDKAKQMEAIREGLGVMQSPLFQQNKSQEYGRAFSLAGKYGFNPHTTATAIRMFGG
jgi:hypothetical protein